MLVLHIKLLIGWLMTLGKIMMLAGSTCTRIKDGNLRGLSLIVI